MAVQGQLQSNSGYRPVRQCWTAVRRVVAALWLAALFGAAAEAAEAQVVAARVVPARVVSVNVCTDQLAMVVAAPGQLIAISTLAQEPHSSAMVAEAGGYAETNGQAETVFQLQPDLVLAGVYSTPQTVYLLQRLGVRVARFASATSIADIAANLRRMGALLGREAQAEVQAAAVERRLAALQADAARVRPIRAAFLDANSYTAGSGTLVHAMIVAAGLRNIAAERGLSHTAHLPLEVLVLSAPDLLLLPERYGGASMAEAVLDHRAVTALPAAARRVEIAGAASTCGTPATLAAVEHLAAARRAFQAAAGRSLARD